MAQKTKCMNNSVNQSTNHPIRKKEFHFMSSDGKTKIHAVKWGPADSRIKAVLQITHGMIEYIDRYDEFACYMARRGFLVVGHDHLGHGDSIRSESDWGYFIPAGKKIFKSIGAHGHIRAITLANHRACEYTSPDPSAAVTADIYRLTCIVRRKYPDCPYFILGHSMGSFLLRRYLTLHSGDITGAVICGTGSVPDAAVQFGMLVCRLLGVLRGEHYRSRLVTNLAFGSAYGRFDMTGQDPSNSWLSKNEESVRAYYQDPRCTFLFTVNGYYTLFSTIYYDNRINNVCRIRKNLPVLFISGADDPVGSFGKGVKKACAQYRRAGIQDVKLKLYENDRHEILQETDRAQIFADIYEWCKKRM